MTDTEPRFRRIERLKESIERQVRGSNKDVIVGYARELAALADDPVIAHEVREPTAIQRALTHGQQAFCELEKLLVQIDRALGGDSAEWLTVSRAQQDLGEIVDRWVTEKARWDR